MYCKNCGKEMYEEQDICLSCGFSKIKGNKYCNKCGVQVDPEQDMCIACGNMLNKNIVFEKKSGKSKVLAGVLQILLPFGVGRLYLGYNLIGVLQIIVTIVTCGVGAIWPFIDGIFILCGKVTDVDGNPLDD